MRERRVSRLDVFVTREEMAERVKSWIPDASGRTLCSITSTPTGEYHISFYDCEEVGERERRQDLACAE